MKRVLPMRTWTAIAVVLAAVLQETRAAVSRARLGLTAYSGPVGAGSRIVETADPAARFVPAIPEVKAAQETRPLPGRLKVDCGTPHCLARMREMLVALPAGEEGRGGSSFAGATGGEGRGASRAAGTDSKTPGGKEPRP